MANDLVLKPVLCALLTPTRRASRFQQMKEFAYKKNNFESKKCFLRRNFSNSPLN